MNILDNKFKIVGTKGDQPIYSPELKRWVELKKINLATAELLVEKGFKYLEEVKLSAEDLSGKTNAELIEMILAKDPEATGLDKLKKSELIDLLTA